MSVNVGVLMNPGMAIGVVVTVVAVVTGVLVMEVA